MQGTYEVGSVESRVRARQVIQWSAREGFPVHMIPAYYYASTPEEPAKPKLTVSRTKTGAGGKILPMHNGLTCALREASTELMRWYSENPASFDSETLQMDRGLLELGCLVRDMMTDVELTRHTSMCRKARIPIPQEIAEESADVSVKTGSVPVRRGKQSSNRVADVADVTEPEERKGNHRNAMETLMALIESDKWRWEFDKSFRPTWIRGTSPSGAVENVTVSESGKCECGVNNCKHQVALRAELRKRGTENAYLQAVGGAGRGTGAAIAL